MKSEDSRPFFSTQDCEAEAIHLSAAIQPDGVLLCLDRASNTILAASANHGMIPQLAGPLLGRSLGDVWPELAGHCPAVPSLVAGSHMVRCHVQGHTTFLEIEPLTDQDRLDAGHLIELEEVLSLFNVTETLEALCNGAVEAIRRISGMERVLIYRFMEEGHGRVLAESKVEDWDESFVGFSFPSADIPAQARALYLKSPCRFVVRQDEEPVPLVPSRDPRDGQPFDLSLCRLRSLSPMHRLYQKNLGVDGAMSVSIINEGRLWGLVVGHHRRPHRVSIPARKQIMALTTGLSMRLSATETADERDARAKHVVLHAKLLEQIAGADDFVSPLINGEVKLTDIFFASSGAAVVYPDGIGGDEHLEVRTVGRAPDCESVVALAQACRSQLVDGIFATDHTASILPPFSRHAAYASGVLAITVGEEGRHMIMWFRPEAVQTTIWGGASPAQVEKEKGEGNYLPRRSFTRWVEEQRGHSVPWSSWKMDIARSLRTALNDVILRQMRTIRSLNARLEESDQAKSRFLAHMSHELRTPLNAVLGFSEMLTDGVYGEMNPRQREGVALIFEAGTHLLNMINDILDLSKIEAGKMELSPTPADLFTLAERVATLVTGMAAERKVAIHIRGGSGVPLVMADERSVKQMLLNLLSNALKFTPKGGDVTVTTALRGDGGVTLAVTDTGVGIPQDKQARVLEPFRQADDEMAHSHGGTGLGLPIVKLLIELHRGALRLKSEVGQGTSVMLDFPASASVP